MRTEGVGRVMVVVWLVLGFGVAWGEDKPWAAGVSQQQQDKALAIYREGNTEFGESRYAQALAKYAEAIKEWDHPMIRFNMAVSLVNLDRPIDAYAELERAMKYGESALGPEAYAQGITYRKLLLGQLATIEISCDDAGAAVSLDGKLLFNAPGNAKRIVRPGEHQVVATKAGYTTETTSLSLFPGKTQKHVIKLVRLELANVKLVRRWKARTPWLVAASGAGVAAIGGILMYFAKQEYATYDDLVTAQCPSGCGPTKPTGMQEVLSSTTAHKDRARLENIVGGSLLVVGGSVAIAGLVGVYLNMPRRVAEQRPTVAPTVTNDGVGAAVQWSF